MVWVLIILGVVAGVIGGVAMILHQIAKHWERHQ